jgi:c-di-GMP-binding flagellar brake protein YcgR
VQRRRHGRYRIWFPVRLTSSEVDGMAVNHNISAGGMMVVVSARMELGAQVKLTFRVPPSGQEQTLHGTVARVESNREDPEGLWPFRMAVAFDRVDPELIPVLEAAVVELADRGSRPPGSD